MVVGFCGHDRLDSYEQTEMWLDEVVRRLVAQGATTFFLGGYGGFDRLALSTIKKEKETHPELQSILILAYLNRAQDMERAKSYDETIYPPLESVPPRLAIIRRNLWMVENCDILVACVTRNWGGAAQTLAVAQRKHRPVILFPNVTAG